MKPYVSIVIPAFNEEEHLGSTLTALRKTEFPPEQREIIVVDNGSTDKTLDIAKQHADRAISFPKGNVGAVRNYGASLSNGEILVFLDADCVVGKEWLRKGTQLIEENPSAAFGGTCNCRTNANWIERYWLLDNPDRKPIQKDLLGSSIFISRSEFIRSGGFNETMTSGEDSDLSNRLRSSGISVIIKSELGVVHLGNPDNLKAFLKRQIWHSENYLAFPRDSFKDITFWIVVLFIAFTTACIVMLASLQTSITTLLMGLLSISLPALLSAKRLARAGFPVISPSGLACIYTLDVIYLIGRSTGLLKSAYRFVKPLRETAIKPNR